MLVDAATRSSIVHTILLEEECLLVANALAHALGFPKCLDLELAGGTGTYRPVLELRAWIVMR